ncbi:pentapeptide repeat-containing protein [Micromonospora sp. NPDC023888]|uniref:pentapeptide repeat-containing protein n=1 Tax=Micromonospora sp. NPDC023888 TaxID=3155607 RepID=UPI00340F2895
MHTKPDKWQKWTAIASLLSVLVVGGGLIGTSVYNGNQQRLGLLQQQLAEQGQITDRFTKAVDQLGQSGPQKIDVRLGAIYALQRIMRDSANDQPAVVDILSAFIRVHAPAPRRTRNSLPVWQLPPRPVDIQAALTVLARRDPLRDGEGHVDLSRADLSRASLLSAHLSGAGLREADLSGADLREANLSDANLVLANLSDADLRGATLRTADLRNANLRNARLTAARLYGADLSNADLGGAELNSADLTAADINPEQLPCTFLDGSTVLPEGIARPPQTPFLPVTDPQCKPIR